MHAAAAPYCTAQCLCFETRDHFVRRQPRTPVPRHSFINCQLSTTVLFDLYLFEARTMVSLIDKLRSQLEVWRLERRYVTKHAKRNRQCTCDSTIHLRRRPLHLEPETQGRADCEGEGSYGDNEVEEEGVCLNLVPGKLHSWMCTFGFWQRCRGTSISIIFGISHIW
ncbi:hypothetical protein G7K_0657-t1 [Saitoella complicata NRRL Y-17804]|uniref:Uncharacterized protein n=1 Tax=Saitoella complicata (strain BCRC 22490 / CBS 7301 / JCM 7358 / NBRC 10748 / NRRL Y-17804) TaxID=698492 RepID=A0A0E9N9Q0_SAICN|nr:hypothetical protein G7K_0657-t1 [Saitoella complicata NRRL Y-17804]